MTDHSEAVNVHYGRKDLSTRILEALKEAGKDPDNLTREDIASFEELHIGGRAETMNLVKLADLRKGVVILDVGCGIGGPARTLAGEFGFSVTGLDLTEEFVSTARMLTELVGMSDLVDFQHGSALDMPFEDDSFDVVWTQHMTMNIEDKATLFSEIRRVLRPDGCYVFHEIMKGNSEELHYPVFWSNKPDLSFLSTPDKVRQMLNESGFEEFRLVNVTDRAVAWFKEMQVAMEGNSPPPLRLGVIVGEDVPAKAANVARNLTEGRIVVIQACYCNTDTG